MEYKKKLTGLLILIGVLAIIYTSSLVFTPEHMGKIDSSYVWLYSKLALRAAKIVIVPAESQDSPVGVELIKKNNQWLVLNNGKEYPARALRVDDFISIFTKRSQWPVRSLNASSHGRFGLDSASATRITIHGENTVLLDILIGNTDVTGREVMVRKYGQNEIRSGDSMVSSYISGPANSWYNLRLIPESEDGKVAVDNVQRLTVYSEGETQVFSRRNRQWNFSGLEAVNLDQSSIDSYVRSVINTEGDDFSDEISPSDPMFSHSRIVLELGNIAAGGIRTIRLSEADDTGRRYANIDGSEYVFSIPSWAAVRLFRSASDFERR
jgi:hypothetical protein